MKQHERPFLVLSRKVIERLLFLRGLSGDRWRGVLGFVPDGSRVAVAISTSHRSPGLVTPAGQGSAHIHTLRFFGTEGGRSVGLTESNNYTCQPGLNFHSSTESLPRMVITCVTVCLSHYEAIQWGT